ncbi:MAG: NAD-dependent epimerase/dehydratase family protein [Clostridium sp.]|uniref:NAD-dependent epimerase/dehydratase family protein n=1 Tax=Clostridium sp. TaxID=1506 RepID=UPI003F38E3AD
MGKILILGGTRFCGKELVKELIRGGDEVTILTRGNSENPFKEDVKWLKADRRNLESMRKALNNLEFDVVYDNLCYSPNDAKIGIEALKGKVKKYIVISSLAVYDKRKGLNLKEYEYDMKKSEIKFGEREEFSYSEGKRLMESVFSKYAEFDVTMVRFPVIIGKDDYTKRLKIYVEKIENEEKIYTTKLEEQMNVITSNEAAIFLKWIKDKEIIGPVNAACNGDVSLKEIIKIIEEETGKKAIIDRTIDVIETSPYNEYLGITISTVYIRGFYFYRFKNALSEIREIIKGYIEK